MNKTIAIGSVLFALLTMIGCGATTIPDAAREPHPIQSWALGEDEKPANTKPVKRARPERHRAAENDIGWGSSRTR